MTQCAGNSRQGIIQKNLVFVRNENLHFASLSPMSLHGGFDRALPKGRNLKIGGSRRSHCVRKLTRTRNFSGERLANEWQLAR